MVGQLNEAVSVSGDIALKGTSARGVLKSVYVTLSGAAGDKVDFKDGGAGGTIICTVEGEAVQQLPYINKQFKSGIYADVTGTTARYLCIFE